MKRLCGSIFLFAFFFSFIFLSSNRVDADVRYAKVIFVGNFDSGKTALVSAYFGERNLAYHAHTIDFQGRLKTFNYQGHDIILKIWDTGGQEKNGYRNVVRSFFRGSQIAFIVVDLTVEIYSLRDLKTRSEGWIEEIRDAVPSFRGIIVGTKKDVLTEQELGRHTDFIKQAARYAKCPYAIVSATNSAEVQRELDRCLREVLSEIDFLNALSTKSDDADLQYVVKLPPEKGCCG